MDKKLLLFFLLGSFFAQSQPQLEIEHTILFSEAIGLNIKKYTRNSQQAFAVQDFERAEFLFDSLVDNVVKGTYLDNFNVRKLSGKKIPFSRFRKPIFLITYSSWCTPGSGEIPALNAIAKKHYKEIDFVILFWDSRKNTRKAARSYSNKIHIVYVDELENTDNYIVERMKHSLGLPTSFLVDQNKRIIAVCRGTQHFYEKEYQASYDMNYNSFLERASLLRHPIEGESPI
ncbi:redoxin domain-containing protein [Aequorivita sp. H23M31]|uniref:Redoxin domain-containing protein n=1 Tax=Aequorivita ciconiae TaxID=2494375 RepID=A0A410G6Z8_9FLAO|nr:redoxin domain-containing protein [Aequorivita sp. H23M31]QAA83053.1 redoxin domain-containing protein [Aequorivita sp. H23M31]